MWSWREPRAPAARSYSSVRVAAADLGDAGERRLRERRAAQVGVHDDAGRVQHPAKAGTRQGVQLARKPSDDVRRFVPRPNLFARAREGRPRRCRARAAGRSVRREPRPPAGRAGRRQTEAHAADLGLPRQKMIVAIFVCTLLISMTDTAAPLSRSVRRRRSHVWPIAAGFALLLLLAGSLLFARALMLRDSVLPGVSVAGVDVGGLSHADARARLRAEMATRLSRPVAVQVGDRSLVVRPDRLWRFDAAATERRAAQAGRESVRSRLLALTGPFAEQYDVEPVLELRPAAERRVLASLERLTPTPRNARLSMDGSDVVLVAARWGHDGGRGLRRWPRSRTPRWPGRRMSSPKRARCGRRSRPVRRCGPRPRRRRSSPRP